MDIDYQNLREVVESLKIRYGESFEYSGIPFKLFTHKHTKRDEVEFGTLPIFWTQSTETDGWDIYLATNVVKKPFRRAVLLHEILEASIDPKLESELGEREGKRKAHEIARDYDRRYARETLDESLFQQYEVLREELNGKFGTFKD